MPLAAALLWAGAAFAADPLPSAAAQPVVAAERARFAAMVKRDTAALDQMLAAGLYYCHSDGQVEDKAQFLETIRSGRLVYHAIDIREIDVRHQSDVAIVTGLVNVRVNVAGKDLQTDLRYSDSYLMRDGRWQLLTWQSTRVP